jgi:hypothetical protein
VLDVENATEVNAALQLHRTAPQLHLERGRRLNYRTGRRSHGKCESRLGPGLTDFRQRASSFTGCAAPLFQTMHSIWSKRMLLQFVLSAGLLLAETPSPATDPIKDELDAARIARSERIDAAKEAFLIAIDEKLKAVAENGNFKLAKEINAQKELFEKDGTLPKAAQLSRAKAAYELEQKAAIESLRKALEKAKKAYTQALKLDEAELVADELKEMAEEIEAKRPVKKSTKSPIKEDVFQAGTVWKGELTQTWESKPVRTTTVRAELTVVERTGNSFKARMDLDGGNKVFEFDGTITPKGVIRWAAAKTVLKQGQGSVFDTFGNLKGEYIWLRFAGVNAKHVNTAGGYKLEVAK